MSGKELEALQREFEVMAREREVALLDTPRFLLRHVCEVAGVSPTKVRNWLTRGVLTLAAERDSGGWRYFTGSDALRIAAVSEFTRLNLPLPWADEMAGVVVDFLRYCMTHPMGTPRNPFWIAQVTDEGLEIDGPHYNLASPEVEPLGVFFKPLEIGQRVFEALGFNFVAGTADELRARANELDGASDD